VSIGVLSQAIQQKREADSRRIFAHLRFRCRAISGSLAKKAEIGEALNIRNQLRVFADDNGATTTSPLSQQLRRFP